MAVNNIIKRLQNIMRSDAGINGDAQRIEQMTWLFFLKVYDLLRHLVTHTFLQPYNFLKYLI